MHGSDKDQTTLNDDLDEFDEEFDDDFDFEEEWEDEEGLDEDLIEEQQLSETTAPEETIESVEDHSESQASQNKSDKPLNPNHFPKKKKKRPLTLIIAIIVIILAIGLTAYNTLQPSLSPTLLPVIKLPGSTADQGDDGFMDDAQKRIDEIMGQKEAKQSAKDNLMKPFGDESATQDSSSLPDQTTASDSVLTPLPTSFDDNANELPSLEKALENVSLGNDAMALSENDELLDDGVIANPFSDDTPLDNAIDEVLPFDTASSEENVKSTDTLELERIEAVALEQRKAEENARKAAEEEEARKEAQARAEAEEARKAKLEAEKQAKMEAARKKEQAASAKQVKTSAVKTQKTVKTPAPKWEIRGIRPDRAVLYDNVSGDIEAVEVGSKIRGLGHVKEISKKNGRWVVLGSNGSVSQ